MCKQMGILILNIKFLCLMLWLAGVCTDDANDDDEVYQMSQKFTCETSNVLFNVSVVWRINTVVTSVAVLMTYPSIGCGISGTFIVIS